MENKNQKPQSLQHYQDGKTPLEESSYQGAFDEHQKYGNGTIYYKNGFSFSTFFINNRNSGLGVLNQSNGEARLAELVENKILFKNDKVYPQVTENFEGVSINFEKDSGIYIGDFKDGKRHGKGKLSMRDLYYSHDNKEFTFKGDFKNGQMDGYITISGDKKLIEDTTWKGGCPVNVELLGEALYQCSFGNKDNSLEFVKGTVFFCKKEKIKNITREIRTSFIRTFFYPDGSNFKQLNDLGKGVKTDRKGLITEGYFNWENGTPLDKVQKRIETDGSIYSGTIGKDKEKHGFGILETEEGDVYEGEFEYDIKWGEGILLKQNGDKIKGEWSNDEKHGICITYFANGDILRCEYNSDMMHRQYSLKKANGEIEEKYYYLDEECEFKKLIGNEVKIYFDIQFEVDEYEGLVNKRNWPHGKGKATFRCGSKFEGILSQRDLQEGELKYSNGDFYTGEFHFGKKHGEGTMVYADGTTYKGRWKYDNFDRYGILTFK